MMHMTFYWGRRVTLLFDFWKTQNWIDYAITLAACFVFSVFYQYMEHRRIRFKRLSSYSVNKPPAAAAVDTPLLSPKQTGNGFRWNWANFAGALLFGVNSAIGYLLMLAIMSFNGGVFLAVVVGLAVGYLIFRCADDDVLVVVDNPCACA